MMSTILPSAHYLIFERIINPLIMESKKSGKNSTLFDYECNLPIKEDEVSDSPNLFISKDELVLDEHDLSTQLLDDIKQTLRKDGYTVEISTINTPFALVISWYS